MSIALPLVSLTGAVLFGTAALMLHRAELADPGAGGHKRLNQMIAQTGGRAALAIAALAALLHFGLPGLFVVIAVAYALWHFSRGRNLAAFYSLNVATTLIALVFSVLVLASTLS